MWINFWKSLFSSNSVNVSYTMPDNLYLGQVQVAQQCVTLHDQSMDDGSNRVIYSEIPSGDFLGISPSGLPFYLSAKVMGHVDKMREIDEQIRDNKGEFECGETIFQILNLATNQKEENLHNMCHLGEEIKPDSHTHFIKQSAITNKDLDCLLTTYEQLTVNEKPLLSKQDAQKIRQKFNAATTIKNTFIQVALISFLNDFTCRYLTPALQYKYKWGLPKSLKFFLENLPSILPLLLNIIYAPNDIIGITTNAVGNVLLSPFIKIPHLRELINCINLIGTAAQTADEAAKGLALHTGLICGQASAAALGQRLASQLIRLLPKLKTEPAPDNTYPTSVLVTNTRKKFGKHRQQQQQLPESKQEIGLRHRGHSG